MAQQRIRHFFPGSNTAAGFVGFYEGLRRKARRAVILKGGAGVGKSTLMAAVGAHFEKSERAVDYFHCSGDPDSLDAVFAPEAGYLVLDGTAPHVIDPRLPGARDGILNLGVCLNEKQLEKEADAIEALTGEIAACYAQAYRYLAAARECRADAAAVYAAALSDQDRRGLVRELLSLLPEAPAGGETHLFAQAITWKGVLQEIDSILTDTAFCLELPWGMDAGSLLRPLFREAEQQGLTRAAYHDPLDADTLSHVTVGAAVFTTAVMLDAPVYRPQLSQDVLRREGPRLAFDRAACELLLNQAVEALAIAKQKHDALERFSIDAMDYARLDEIKAAFLRSLP